MAHTETQRHRVFYEKRDVLKFFGTDFTDYAVVTREGMEGDRRILCLMIFGRISNEINFADVLALSLILSFIEIIRSTEP